MKPWWLPDDPLGMFAVGGVINRLSSADGPDLCFLLQVLVAGPGSYRSVAGPHMSLSYRSEKSSTRHEHRVPLGSGKQRPALVRLSYRPSLNVDPSFIDFLSLRSIVFNHTNRETVCRLPGQCGGIGSLVCLCRTRHPATRLRGFCVCL